MKIKVCEKNREKIAAAIDKVQSKARARTIDVDDIFWYCERIEKTYGFIPKSHRSDSVFSIDKHAQSFPNAYHGRPESTQFDLLYRNGNYYLMTVGRVFTRSSDNLEVAAVLSQEAKDALLNAYAYPAKYRL